MKTEIIKNPKIKPTKLQFSDNAVRDHDYYDDTPSLTDQSDLRSTDINVIMEQYAKTGMLPIQDRLQGIYADVSDVPSIETAFKIAKEAQDLFYGLPAEVRRDMDNDPSQLENYVSDVNNRDFLIKHGVLVESKKADGGPQKTPEEAVTTENKKEK